MEGFIDFALQATGGYYFIRSYMLDFWICAIQSVKPSAERRAFDGTGWLIFSVCGGLRRIVGKSRGARE
ncbi:MAG: hypothetical protein SAMD01599839_08430 [Rectinema sp.]